MRSFLRVFSVILLVAWMGCIFFLSAQNAETSSQTSGQIIETLAEKFYPEFNQMTETEKEDLIESLQFVVRKSAHAAMFAVLGFLAFLTFISYVDLRFLTRISLAFAVSAIYAASDEYHQRFVVGRSCELRDFLIDILGISAAILLCTIFVKVIAPLRRKTAYEGVSIKSLRELNLALYEKLDAAKSQNTNLQIEIDEQKETIEKLRMELSFKEPLKEPEKLFFEEPVIEIEKQTFESLEPIEEIEEIDIQTETEELEAPSMKLDSEMEYAAKVIGDCVVEVTKVCNEVTISQNAETSKELVNLALGRCEVLKSEILKIMSDEISFEEKKDLIEKERKDTFDYFDSIKAQM